MKIIFFLFLIPIILSSCKKENNVDNPALETDQELYDIKFSTTGFTTSIEPIGKKSSLKSDSKSQSIGIDTSLVSKINFIIYTSDNTSVGNYAQEVGDPDFGNLNLKLGAGTFKIGVVGYKNPGYLSAVSGGPRFELSFPPNYEHEFLYLESRNEESFSYGYKEFTVSKDSVYAPFELKRLNAKLEIEILDILPNDVDNLIITYIDDLSGDELVSTNSYGVDVFSVDGPNRTQGELDKAFNLIPFRGKKNVKFTDIVYPYKKSGSKGIIRISIKSKTPGRSKDITLTGVEFKSNYITKVSGEVYGNMIGNENLGFQTKLIKEYDGNIEVDF